MSLKIVIAGGGSTYTPGIVKTLFENRARLNFSEIFLYDISKKKVEEMKKILNHIDDVINSKVLISASTDPNLAFSGADYIFSQIRVGGLIMREFDEKIPLKYGLIGQETCGLGGFAYGMRSMKGFLEMVHHIQEIAPEAWILNYTNPESIISEAVRRKYPKAKIINACDMTQGIEQTLAENFGFFRENWQAVYYGLNHFGWYHEIYDTKEKRDLLPEMIKKIELEGMFLSEGDKSWKETYRVMGEMVKNFNTHIPNNYLEYYLYPDLKVEKANKNYTRANEVMDGRENELKAMLLKISKGEKITVESSGHGQYIVDIAISIEHDLNLRCNLIVPNMGAIPNLRSDAVVEIPAYVSSRGVEPISLRFNIPDFHKGLMEAQVASEKLLVDAFFEGSYRKALEAFTLNQTVPSATIAKKILDEFIIVNKDFWPELK